MILPTNDFARRRKGKIIGGQNHGKITFVKPNG